MIRSEMGGLVPVALGLTLIEVNAAVAVAVRLKVLKPAPDRIAFRSGVKNRPIALPFAAVNRVVTCTELAMAPVPAEASAVKEPHGAVEQPAVPLHTPRTISAWFKTGAEAVFSAEGALACATDSAALQAMLTVPADPRFGRVRRSGARRAGRPCVVSHPHGARQGGRVRGDLELILHCPHIGHIDGEAGEAGDHRKHHRQQDPDRAVFVLPQRLQGHPRLTLRWHRDLPSIAGELLTFLRH